MDISTLKKRVRYIMAFYILALFLSALTAIPLGWELGLVQTTMGKGTFMESIFPAVVEWISYLQKSITELQENYAFIFYGVDWLAFGIIIIGIAFIGPLRDPVRNIWVVDLGIIACILVIPVALICGPIRGIPWFHVAVDCSFGVIGIIPLWVSRRYIKRIEALEKSSDQ